MTSVNTQSAMALKALSPLPMKDSSLFPLENGDDDAMSDDSFHLHLSEDEEEDKNDKKNEKSSDLSPETEDDILNRVISRFDGADGPTTDTPPLEQVDEDKLLNDGEETENDGEEPETEEVEKKSIEKSSEPSKPSSEESEIIKNNCENKSVSKDDVTKTVSDVNKVPCDENKSEPNKVTEEEQAKEEQAENLKNQIMDPEDLLQIVDKETDENDKETEENDKDSSGGNSPRSVDKGDSDEVEEKTETEKMDEEEEEEDSRKSIEKDEVDIDESTPSESDAELDKVYKSLAEGQEDIEKEDANKKKTKDDASGMDTSTCDDGNKEKDGETPAAVESNEEATNKKVTLNEETGVVEKSLTTEEEKGDSDSDTSSKTSKRSLSDSDVATSAKKIKLQSPEGSNVQEKNIPTEEEKQMEVVSEPEAPPPPPPIKIVALNAIEEFMKAKTVKKLTYRDLEQIVLQKICESICHKSEIGELRHQLGVQEQMVEMWRKEVAQLTKQARDLEIVNKRLLHEVRLKNERDKPLIPVKITRSVGLQVRSDANMINNSMTPRRRVPRPQIANPQSTIAPAKQNRFNAANRANTINRVTTTTNRIIPVSRVATTPNRITPVNKIITNKIIATGPLKKVTPGKTNSLLSKALQNSTAVAQAAASNTPTTISTTPILTPIPPPTLTAITIPTATPSTSTANKSTTNVSVKSGGKSHGEPKVIDLTDEDDKKSGSTTTQGVRIISTPVKTVVTTPGVVNPPRIMYVYNNQLHQGVLSTDTSKLGTQKLMLKLNSNVLGQANGVLTAVQNGSAIAVSTAGGLRAGQVQPVRLATPLTPIRNNSMPSKTVLRHPAPLPPPPANQLCLPSRKPVPPKPHLSIKRSNGGLILSWKMPYNLDSFEAIASYQLYAYQETTSPPSSEMWRKVGDVKALALPMACTLTQFADGNKYHFAVRAVDVQKRMGPFSDPEQILL